MLTVPRPSDMPITVTVYSVFQLGSTLGTQEISIKQTISTSDFPRDIHSVTLGLGRDEHRLKS